MTGVVPFLGDTSARGLRPAQFIQVKITTENDIQRRVT